MMLSFFLSAVMHPQEFACVLPLLIYMLLIPSMYMLLSIYSATNMHVVAWGTREVKSKLSAKEVAQQKADAEAAEAEAAAAAAKVKKEKSIFSMLDFSRLTGSGSGLFTCMCCSNQRDDDTAKIAQIHGAVGEMRAVVNKLLPVETSQPVRGSVARVSSLSRRKSNSLSSASTSLMAGDGSDKASSFQAQSKQDDHDQEDHVNQPEVAQQETSLDNADNGNTLSADDVDVPKWIRLNDKLKHFRRIPLNSTEQIFWRDMIDKYLLPLIEDRNEKKRIENDLLDLRNKVVFAFGFLNVIFVLFVFLLQMHKNVFGIKLPVGVHYNNTLYDEESESYREEPIIEYTVMDPIGLCLVVCFGIILIVQITGEYIHSFISMLTIMFLDTQACSSIALERSPSSWPIPKSISSPRSGRRRRRSV